MERRRVVVTGLGAITPLGVGAGPSWDAACEGRSGIRTLTRFDFSDYAVHFAGEVPGDFDLGDLPAKEARRLDRAVKLSVFAASEAAVHAGLVPGSFDPDRVGIAIGSGIGGLESFQEGHRALFAKGPRRVGPFMIPNAICNMSSGFVAIRQNMRGPNLCPVAACASGSQAIGDAARVIERGDADAMLAGGSEAPVTQIGMAAFAAMRALSTRNDAPEAASRPFDRARDGFVMGEGSAVLALESEEHAVARGAKILARVLGYASTADAAFIATPTEDAEGAQRCMKLALADAGVGVEDVDYLNAHATSTPAGDVAEARAIRATFGAHVDTVAVSSTKGMTGHLLGAAGSLEALFCVRALETGVIPPTLNLDDPDPECELDHVANKARHGRLGLVLSNSFGFGGTNASLVIGAS